MKVVIAGGRDIPPRVSYPLLLDAVQEFEAKYGGITEVVSGAEPNGVDRMGETWAEGLFIPIRKFPADWDQHSRAAGPIRNRQMAEYAEGLIVIHNVGRGSASMIREAKRQKLPKVERLVAQATTAASSSTQGECR